MSEQTMSRREFVLASAGVGVAVLTSGALTGCVGGGGAGGAGDGTAGKKQVTINVKCPPVTMAYDADHPDAEVFDLFQEAGERFAATYENYDVSFNYTKFQYVDEKTQVIDKFGTPEAADVLFAGSFNLPTYIREGRVAALDDVIDAELRADIDDAIWQQCSVDGVTYTMPLYQLQNTLMVNGELMRAAGLDRFIPAEGEIAQWSIDEFNEILNALKASMAQGGTFPLAFYAANNQGDTHIMTLLRAFGAPFYNADGTFDVSSPEGVRALEWLVSLNERGIIPKGAENLEFIDTIQLFNSGQVALCPGNMVNVRIGDEAGLDVFLANFPDPTGAGIATTFLNGFTVFNNGDPDKVQATKDFVRFIYSDDDMLRYALSSIPVNKHVVEQHKDEIAYLDTYSRNSQNTVDFLNNTPNWEGVRAAFYPNMQDLLRGTKAPAEVAAAIDEGCNAARAEGLAAIEAARS
ncbi:MULTISPECIES: ABC transporter substrate-binding protein [Gordonibacter]|uniref:Extracellular solute-binding protein n=1 Tax=Gordonibacter faecis TaxID=3047475 RepID=A0ABT7DPH7_9ACTN|nr:extracellular solute-binding protein [Gordonibacter sp. KGMB12511]MDJ1651443.1 extracellular solute-binding protein [Gordonibacter sp. KGMB12511]